MTKLPRGADGTRYAACSCATRSQTRHSCMRSGRRNKDIRPKATTSSMRSDPGGHSSRVAWVSP